jgi:hypothetical protein
MYKKLIYRDVLESRKEIILEINSLNAAAPNVLKRASPCILLLVITNEAILTLFV